MDKFRCHFCRKEYSIGNMGHSAITQHIAQAGHQSKKADALDTLKFQLFLLLDESADGLSAEELARRTPNLGEMPLDAETRDRAITALIEEGIAIPHRDLSTGALIRLELERETEEAEKETTGINISQCRPAFVFLVKEKGMARAQVANLFGVSPNMVGDAVKRYEETGTCKNRPGQGRSRTTPTWRRQGDGSKRTTGPRSVAEFLAGWFRMERDKLEVL